MLPVPAWIIDGAALTGVLPAAATVVHGVVREVRAAQPLARPALEDTTVAEMNVAAAVGDIEGRGVVGRSQGADRAVHVEEAARRCLAHADIPGRIDRHPGRVLGTELRETPSIRVRNANRN
jgi:hypothetical protein